MSQAPHFITPVEHEGGYRQFPGVVQAAGPRVSNGDWLALSLTTTDSSGSVEINGRILTDLGEIVPFAGLMTFSGTGAQTAIIARLGGGWLQGFDVHRVSGTLTDGEVVATVHLGCGEGSTARFECCLASGEVTNTISLGMGGFTGVSKDPQAAYNPASVVAVANPAAGADWTLTVPATHDYEVFSLHARMVFSAAVANRNIEIAITNGANKLANLFLEDNWTASKDVKFQIVPGLAMQTYDTSTPYIEVITFFPAVLPASSVLTVTTTNIQAADQWSEIALTCRPRPI